MVYWIIFLNLLFVYDAVTFQFTILESSCPSHSCNNVYMKICTGTCQTVSKCFKQNLTMAVGNVYKTLCDEQIQPNALIMANVFNNGKAFKLCENEINRTKTCMASLSLPCLLSFHINNTNQNNNYTVKLKLETTCLRPTKVSYTTTSTYNENVNILAVLLTLLGIICTGLLALVVGINCKTMFFLRCSKIGPGGPEGKSDLCFSRNDSRVKVNPWEDDENGTFNGIDNGNLETSMGPRMHTFINK